MNKVKKGARYFLYTLLTIVIALNLFILLSGRIYLYSGIMKTYAIGKSSPGIYDLNVFPHSTIEKANKPYLWKNHERINQFRFDKFERKYHQRLGTKAFLVFKNDTLLFEKYFGSHKKETVSNSFSAAKTVIALLIGIAIEEGKIKSVDEPVGHYLLEFNENGRNDITIRHLLQMAAGFDWEESGSNPISEAAEAYYGDDLYGLVTRQHVVEKPGTKFNYQSGDTQILGFILQKATGKSISEYTEEKLWKTMGAGHQAFWSLDKENGDEKAFCCLYATPRDFSLIGLLILNQGKIGDQQIVPKWYINEMVKTPAMATEENIRNLRYGWHIWTYKNKGNPVYYCRGFKGQYIMAIPSKQLLVVRLGMEREDNFLIPQSKSTDRKFHLKYDEHVGHSMDLFVYLKMAEKIDKEIYQNERRTKRTKS
jgi:CubicO group peptidase (beta-lactamase class C family)